MQKLENSLNVAIVPSGQWGSALGLKAAENDHNVTLYFRDQKKANHFNENKTHSKLEGIKFPENVNASDDLEETVSNAQIIVLAPPARFMREIAASIEKYIPEGTVILSASKGLDPKSNQLLTQVIAEEIPSSKSLTVAISGPNFAREVAEGKFAGTDIAIPHIENLSLKDVLLRAFCSRNFLTYFHDDQIGLQIGGAYKNPIAFAAGVVTGLEVGENARAFLPETGIDEANELSVSLGGRFLSRAARADVWLSCSPTSRNNAAGIEVGRGRSVKELLESSQTIESIHTAPGLFNLAQQKGVSTPILEGVTRIISGEDPRRVVLAGVINSRRLIRGF